MRIIAGAAATVLIVACSSSSGGSGGGGLDAGGTCPLTLSSSQVPFGDQPCNALTAADFKPYGATLQTAKSSSCPQCCDYAATYANGDGGTVDLDFYPACDYDTYRATAFQEQDAGGNGGPPTTGVVDLQGIGDAAFYENQGADMVYVRYKQVMLYVSGNLCAQSGGCPSGGGALTKDSTIALAKLIVSRF